MPRDAGIEVSVILPTMGDWSLLRRSLRSIESQSFTDFQIILVLDDKFSEKFNLIQSLLASDFEIDFLRKVDFVQSPFQGAGANRNFGLSRALGKFVCFLDDDDEFDRKKIEIQLAFMRRKKIDFSHTNYWKINHSKHPSEVRVSTRMASGKFVAQQILEHECFIATPTVMFRKSLLTDFSEGLFPTSLASGEDIIAWLRLVLRHGLVVGHVKKCLSNVHIIEQSTQRTNGLDVDAFQKFLKSESLGVTVPRSRLLGSYLKLRKILWIIKRMLVHRNVSNFQALKY